MCSVTEVCFVVPSCLMQYRIPELDDPWVELGVVVENRKYFGERNWTIVQEISSGLLLVRRDFGLASYERSDQIQQLQECPPVIWRSRVAVPIRLSWDYFLDSFPHSLMRVAHRRLGYCLRYFYFSSELLDDHVYGSCQNNPHKMDDRTDPP